MKTKIISVLLLTVSIINIFAIAASADSGTNWYVKRNGNKRPTISEEQRIIEKYNGYYIDNSLTDSSEKKKLYLTFDAGYENGNVEKIVDILKEKGVSGAFFILDRIIITNPDLIKKMHENGNLICNHTKNHKDLTKLEDAQIKKNLKALETFLEEKTGITMAKYFRFPEGKYNERTLSLINSLGYKTVFWSLAYADWDNEKQPDAKKSMDLLLKNTHNGAVILLHPTSETNVKILPTLIDKWLEMGYTFGTLDELTA